MSIDEQIMEIVETQCEMNKHELIEAMDEIGEEHVEKINEFVDIRVEHLEKKLVDMIQSPVTTYDNDILIQLLPNFTPNEEWGELDKINPNLLVLLQDLRYTLKHGFTIHCAYETTGHSDGSKHGTGDAVDFHITGGFLEYYEMIEKRLDELGLVDTVGLGIYPWWNSPGFHLDFRDEKGRWGRLEDGSYVSVEEAIRVYKG